MSADLIAALDSALAGQGGEDIVLRRTYGQAPRMNYVEIKLRAAVRGYQPVELVSGISQTDSKVIISPTGLRQRGWPGGEAPSATVAEPWLPRTLDDVFIGGRKRSIQVVTPFRPSGEVVRIEMRVLG